MHDRICRLRLLVAALLVTFCVVVAPSYAAADAVGFFAHWETTKADITLVIDRSGVFTLEAEGRTITGEFTLLRNGLGVLVADALGGRVVLDPMPDTAFVISVRNNASELMPQGLELTRGRVIADWLGTTVGVFIGLTLLVMGGAAFLTGQAVAKGWGGAGTVAAYAVLLTGADRFLVFALFGGELLSVTGFLIDLVILGAIALAAHRFTRARKMVAQYPWRYAPAGPFGWREKTAG